MHKLVIVGVGALGSHLVQFVRSLPEVDLVVIDDDRVERKNVLSQFHARSAVGKRKVLSLQQTMSFLFDRRLQTIPHRLTADNVETLLDGADLVVDCLDHGASRALVQRHARARELPCLHGALAADGSFGRVIWDEQFHIDHEPGEGVATCEDGEHLPFIVATAAHLALAIQRYLANGERRGFSLHAGGVTAH